MRTKKQRIWSTIMKAGAGLIFLLAALTAVGTLPAYAAMDTPHNASISCGTCHTPSPTATWWTDQGATGGLCGQCHFPGSPKGDAMAHITGSGYGDLKLQCSVCHDPHYQRQLRTWKAGNASYQTTGVVTGVSPTTLTKTGAGWPVNWWAGMVLVPNTSYVQYNYIIASNTQDTITIDTTRGDAINLAYVTANVSTFGISYGNLVRQSIGGLPVKFFRKTGTNSFADDDLMIDGVCQVCHTRTVVFNRGGNLNGGLHPTDQAGKLCVSCHKHDNSNGGFAKGGCTTCHGSPPNSLATLIFKDKDEIDITNGSPVSFGAHPAHISAGFDCVNCHTGGMLGGAAEGDNNINIGFNLKSTNLGGSYDRGTRTDSGSAATPFGYAGGGTTTITSGGTFKCSNLYCHDPGGLGTDEVKPAWNGSLPDVAQCDSCHGGNRTSAATPGAGPMTTGKHTAHIANTDANLGSFACGQCHSGTVTTGDDRTVTGSAKHANMTKDVEYDSLNTGATNGTCNNLYCHSDGKSGYNNQDLATVWYGGTTVLCKGCHGDNGTSLFGEPDYASGGGGTATANSHGLAAHVSAATDCGKCHASTSTTGTSITGSLHINESIDVAVNSTIDNNGASANYDGAVGQKSCSATTCHGTLSPKWGTDNSGSKDCTKCHGRLTATGSYTTPDAAPGIGGTGKDTGGDTVNTDNQVGAHQAHLEGTRNYSNAISCGECHTVPAAFADNGHIYDGTNDTTKGVAELVFGTLAKTGSLNPQYNTPTAGKCSATWCHGAGLSGGDKVPTWNTPILTGVASNDCTKCHDWVPAPSAVALHSGKVATDCKSCHTHVNPSGTGFDNKALHVNGIKEGGDNCYDCHSSAGGKTAGTTPDAYHARHVQTAFIGKISTGDYGRLTGGSGPNWYSYSNTGGLPDMGCGYCHPTSGTTHMNNSINLNFNPADTGAAGTLKAKNHATETYYQDPTPDTLVTCSSAYCHSNGYNPGSGYGYQTSMNWYSTQAAIDAVDKCGLCHGNFPNVGRTGSPAHPVHAVGIHYDNIFNGTSGLATAGNGNTNSHGSGSYSTTINCNVCHTGTVTAAYNAGSSACNGCHSDTNTPATGNEKMVILAGSTLHVNGTIEVSLANIATLRSKAQIRTAAPAPWTRNVGYKVAGANDSHSLASGERSGNNCTVACHMDQTVTWTTPVTCGSCHTTLP